MKTLSIVLPIYNEAACIPELVTRLDAVSMGMREVAIDYIFVDDCSRDASRELLTALARTRTNVTVLFLAKNFGHQAAITAGIDHARGDFVVVMDSDLQDPPELIPKMIETAAAGHDIVYAVREQRAGEGKLKRLSAFVYYRLMKCVTGLDVPVDTGDFRLMTKPVTEAFRGMREQHRYVRGMIAWLGFRQVGIDYRRDPRFAGKTNYTMKKMLRLAKNGIISFTNMPLRVSLWFGTLGGIIGFVLLAWVAWLKFITHSAIPGWSSQMFATIAFGSIILLCLGLQGSYIAKIFDEVRRRPLYIVAAQLGGITLASSSGAPTAEVVKR